MSRRLLMSSRGTPAVTPTDPGGGVPPGGDGFPATTDPTLAALRPTGTRVLVTATATPGDDLSTVVTNLQDNLAALVETSYGRQGPDHSAILYLPPGNYTGGFGVGSWLSIVGTSGNPADVVIFSDTIQSDGVMHPYSPVYVESVTLKGGHNTTLDQSPKYAVHIAGSARTTFANVIFDTRDAGPSATDPTWGGGSTVGMDGSPGTNLIFYGCTFLPTTFNTAVGMNLHAGPAGGPPIRVSFINCTAPRGIAYSGGPDGLDELYVIGGTIATQANDIHVQDGVTVYTDLDVAVTGAVAVNRNHTSWPIPVNHGLTQFWMDYLYPSRLLETGTIVTRATVTDAAPMTPVAGRTYYCPVPVTTVLWLNRYGLQVHSGAGKAISYRPAPDTDTFYGSIHPANYPPVDPLNATTLGTGQWLTDFYYSWMLYPSTPVGGTRLWFAFKMADVTGVSIDGSASLPGLHDCYYSDNDGTTLVKATAGTPFPLAHAAQVR